MTSKYDAWLQAPYHENDDDEFNDHVNELLQENYNIQNFDHFFNAITDIGTDEYNELKDKISDHLTDRNFELLGRALWAFACDKLERYAENEAISDFTRGYGN
jgi:transcription termination factor NusB